MSDRCYRLHTAWRKLVRQEMKWTSLRRRLEAKTDRGKALTRPERDRVSVAKAKENQLGRKMSSIIAAAHRQDCDLQHWGPVPVRRASSKAPPYARKRFRSEHQKLHASMTCRPQCQHLADRAEVAFKAGDDKRAAHYGNRYWRCVEDCYEHELPRRQRSAEGKSRRLRRKYY